MVIFKSHYLITVSFFTFAIVMIDKLYKYFTDSSELAAISELELENKMEDAPNVSAYRMLLAKKRSNIDGLDIMLGNNDRVWLHYLLHSGNGISDINEYSIQEKSLNENNNNTAEIKYIKTSHEESSEVRTLDADLNLASSFLERNDNNVVEINTVTENREVQTKYKTTQIEEIKKTKKTKNREFKLKEYSGISEFAIWLLSFRNNEVEKLIIKEEKLAKKKLFEQNAMKSVKKTSTIISEPLAEILTSQGHLDDAKKMYEQLMLKYPEKSIYFAAKINSLIKI